MTAVPHTHKETALMAHLLRRAGFGATRDELDKYVSQGYQALVEELLHPERQPELEEDIIRRYNMDQNSLMLIESSQAYWMYRIVNTQRPLEEKMALFWHGLFATAYGKLNHAKAVVNQTNTFRRYGLGHFGNLLLELSRDPAMIFWLDNKDNHKGAPNENYGRELLELFSMGIGTYTEDDVKACARAFTGWTIANADYMSQRASRDSIWPHGRLDWQFQYLPEDHDDSDKTFLGHTGRFNGEDIIDIIIQQPATAWFIAGKLYAFFVADTPDETAIQLLADEFQRSGGDIRQVMQTLFLSGFPGPAGSLGSRQKPAELVAGTARLAGSHQFPDWSTVSLAMDANFMGQEILNPPTVEGWHTGAEWIDTGNLVERINSAALEIGDILQPGVRAVIDRIRSQGEVCSVEELVALCLESMGLFEVSEVTRQGLLGYAQKRGALRFDRQDQVACSEQRVGEMLQLIVATRSTSWPDAHPGRWDTLLTQFLDIQESRTNMNARVFSGILVLVLAIATIAGWLLYLPVQGVIILGSALIPGFIGWRLTTYNNPVESRNVINLYLLAVALQTVHLEVWPESGGSRVSGYTWGQQV